MANIKAYSYFIIILVIVLFIHYCAVPEKKEDAGPPPAGTSIKNARDYLESIGKKFTEEELVNLSNLNLSNTRIKDKDIARLKPLVNLGELKLNSTEITGEGLEYLAGLDKLESIDLSGSSVTDKGLVSLLSLKHLTVINLSGTGVSDEGLKHLKDFTDLKELDLSGTDIQDSSLINLSGLINLEKLILRETGISDNGLLHLQVLNSLNYLDLSGTGVNGNGLVYLEDLLNLKVLLLADSEAADSELADIRNLKRIEYLDLSDTEITNACLEYLKHIDSLQYLNLDNTKVTGKGFYHFSEFRNLKYLSINGISTTYSDFMDLKISLPGVRITAQYMIFPADSSIQENSHRDKPDESQQEEKTDDLSYPAYVSVKNAVIVGIGIPFQVVFLDKNRKIDTDFVLDSNLIFRLKGVTFTISSLNNFYRGDGEVEIPYEKADFNSGIFRGKISLERLVTGSRLKVYLKKKDGEPELIARTRMDLMFMDIAGIVFSPGYLTVKAGTEFQTDIIPYSYLGKPLTGKAVDDIRFDIIGGNPVVINDRKTIGEFKINSDLFKDGEAVIKVKAEQQGIYTIIYRSGKRFNAGTGKGSSWNEFSFKITPAEPVRAEFIMPEIVKAGEEFRISKNSYDKYGNRIDSGLFDFRVFPFPDGKLIVNGDRASKEIIKIKSGSDRIKILKSGIYMFFFPGFDKMITEKITVKPAEIQCRIDRDNIRRLNNDRKIIIPLQFLDEYGNSSDVDKEFNISIKYNSSGFVRINGRGIDLKKKVSRDGRNKYASVSVYIKKGTVKGIIELFPENTNFLSLLSPENSDIVFKIKLSQKHIIVNKTGDRVKIEYTKIPEKDLLYPVNLSELLNKYPDPVLFVTWEKKGSSAEIKYEFTFFRELNRLDYQEWDITNKKRLLRILWKDISESEIKNAASSGLKELPGSKEIFR